MKPGTVVVVLGKLDDRIHTKDKTKLVVGTYMGDLRLENADCYVLLEDGTLWVGMKRELTLYKGQE